MLDPQKKVSLECPRCKGTGKIWNTLERMARLANALLLQRSRK